MSIFAKVTEKECITKKSRPNVVVRNISYIYLLSLAFIFREPRSHIGLRETQTETHLNGASTQFTGKRRNRTLWICYQL